MTSSMPWKRAPSCATGPHAVGCNFLIVYGHGRFVKLPPRLEWDLRLKWRNWGIRPTFCSTEPRPTGSVRRRNRQGTGARAARGKEKENKTYVTGNTSGGFRCLRQWSTRDIRTQNQCPVPAYSTAASVPGWQISCQGASVRNRPSSVWRTDVHFGAYLAVPSVFVLR
jgi:hypothetical protein